MRALNTMTHDFSCVLSDRKFTRRGMDTFGSLLHRVKSKNKTSLYDFTF